MRGSGQLVGFEKSYDLFRSKCIGSKKRNDYQRMSIKTMEALTYDLNLLTIVGKSKTDINLQ